MSFYKKYWQELGDKPQPHYLRNIISIDANEFADMVHSASKKDARNLAESINSGDAYVLKSAVDEDRIEDIKTKVFNWSKGLPSEYHEMRDGCPDYHCINDKPKGPMGGYTTIEHSYVFFRHNKDDFTGSLFKLFDKYWSAIKVLSGHEKDAFTNNIPSDGIIDRITFLHYPHNCGKISKHFDSSKIQKLLLGCLFSQIGEDYDYGKNGFYVVDNGGRKIYLENIAKKGDFICVSPTLYHGVPNVTSNKNKKPTDWDSLEGRWYLQLYSPESHEVGDRDFTVGIADENNQGPIANYIGDK